MDNMNEVLTNERLMKLSINLERIADALEKQNELKQKDLELQKYYIDFEVKKYQDALNIKRIEKNNKIRTDLV